MYYGLLGLVTVLISIVGEIMKSISEKKYYWIVFVGALIIRSFTDKLMGGGPFDVFIYYLFFLMLNRKERKSYSKYKDTAVNLEEDMSRCI